MDHGLGLEACEDTAKSCGLGYVELFDAGRPPGNGGNAFGHIALGIGKVVEDQDIMICIQQLDHRVASNIPRPSSDRDPHQAYLQQRSFF